MSELACPGDVSWTALADYLDASRSTARRRAREAGLGTLDALRSCWHDLRPEHTSAPDAPTAPPPAAPEADGEPGGELVDLDEERARRFDDPTHLLEAEPARAWARGEFDAAPADEESPRAVAARRALAYLEDLRGEPTVPAHFEAPAAHLAAHARYLTGPAPKLRELLPGAPADYHPPALMEADEMSEQAQTQARDLLAPDTSRAAYERAATRWHCGGEGVPGAQDVPWLATHWWPTYETWRSRVEAEAPTVLDWPSARVLEEYRRDPTHGPALVELEREWGSPHLPEGTPEPPPAAPAPARSRSPETRAQPFEEPAPLELGDADPPPPDVSYQRYEAERERWRRAVWHLPSGQMEEGWLLSKDELKPERSWRYARHWWPRYQQWVKSVQHGESPIPQRRWEAVERLIQEGEEWAWAWAWVRQVWSGQPVPTWRGMHTPALRRRLLGSMDLVIGRDLAAKLRALEGVSSARDELLSWGQNLMSSSLHRAHGFYREVAQEHDEETCRCVLTSLYNLSQPIAPSDVPRAVAMLEPGERVALYGATRGLTAALPDVLEGVEEFTPSTVFTLLRGLSAEVWFISSRLKAQVAAQLKVEPDDPFLSYFLESCRECPQQYEVSMSNYRAKLEGTATLREAAPLSWWSEELSRARTLVEQWRSVEAAVMGTLTLTA